MKNLRLIHTESSVSALLRYKSMKIEELRGFRDLRLINIITCHQEVAKS
jgi:hypothetical protein